jgi:hypothetical protein
MKLRYTLEILIDPIWIDGELPYPDMGIEKVRVRIQGVANGSFPRFVEEGELLPYRRRQPEQHAITLLLIYGAGTVPLSASPASTTDWAPVPGSPVFGQIRVPLTAEAIQCLRRVDEPSHQFELVLDEVSFEAVPGSHQRWREVADPR